MEPVARIAVTVTFLRMDAPPREPGPSMPEGGVVARVQPCSVAFYRYLYATVGAPHVWWLRRTASDSEIAALLAHRRVAIHALYLGGEPVGFHELDARHGGAVNLSYFGLVPHAIGRGFGRALLRHAVDTAWQWAVPGGPVDAVTVNTCTADHPRAMPTYLRAGFRPVRQVREHWDVPLRLGLAIPESLRI